MMPTIRDYADESRYHTDFQDFKEFLSHRNYDFHIRALDAESEADIIAAQEILMSAFNYKEVHDV